MPLRDGGTAFNAKELQCRWLLTESNVILAVTESTVTGEACNTASGEIKSLGIYLNGEMSAKGSDY